MMAIRTGVMLLGPPACGKSTVITALSGALTELDAEKGIGPVQVARIFPKVCVSLCMDKPFSERMEDMCLCSSGKMGGKGKEGVCGIVLSGIATCKSQHMQMHTSLPTPGCVT